MSTKVFAQGTAWRGNTKAARGSARISARRPHLGAPGGGGGGGAGSLIPRRLGATAYLRPRPTAVLARGDGRTESSVAASRSRSPRGEADRRPAASHRPVAAPSPAPSGPARALAIAAAAIAAAGDALIPPGDALTTVPAVGVLATDARGEGDGDGADSRPRGSTPPSSRSRAASSSAATAAASTSGSNPLVANANARSPPHLSLTPTRGTIAASPRAECAADSDRVNPFSRSGTRSGRLIAGAGMPGGGRHVASKSLALAPRRHASSAAATA
mmetsp:Transcript_7056/g.30953  ORF Transcript_7056/g.30953 Transcript_7056/m.30953 type:complete len:273 (-) Transcript_7056:3835-4653(-)